jgi:hypothetical protein
MAYWSVGSWKTPLAKKMSHACLPERSKNCVVAASGCQAVRGEGLVQPGPAVTLTSAAPIFSQRAIAGKTTIAAGRATPQNTIAPPSKTVSVKIDFIFFMVLNVYWFSIDLILY